VPVLQCGANCNHQLTADNKGTIKLDGLSGFSLRQNLHSPKYHFQVKSSQWSNKCQSFRL